MKMEHLNKKYITKAIKELDRNNLNIETIIDYVDYYEKVRLTEADVKKVINTIEIESIHTDIVQKIYWENKIIIREDYYKYPKSQSNIYALDYKGNVLWFAELPMNNDCYANSMSIENRKLKTCSWNGFSVLLDLNNGKIIKKEFIK